MLSSKNLLAHSFKRFSVGARASAVKLSSSRSVTAVVPSLQHQHQQPARAFSWDSSKSSPEALFKLTSQALIHDISLHQMETVKTVVPWFLSNMPVSE